MFRADMRCTILLFKWTLTVEHSNSDRSSNTRFELYLSFTPIERNTNVCGTTNACKPAGWPPRQIHTILEHQTRWPRILAVWAFASTRHLLGLEHSWHDGPPWRTASRRLDKIHMFLPTWEWRLRRTHRARPSYSEHVVRSSGPNHVECVRQYRYRKGHSV